MFAMMQSTYEMLSNYVFGSNIYTIMAVLFLVAGFMVFKGFSFDVIIITFRALMITGGIWLFPSWTLGLIAIIAFFIIGYLVSRVLER